MSIASTVREAAIAFLASLDEQQQASANAGLDDPARTEWTYLPGQRPGLQLAEMSEVQRALALSLLDSACSAARATTARGIIELDAILRGAGRAGQYWFRVFGSPSASEPWTWRVNGHHLGVHLTLSGESVTVTPNFFGAEPATVLSGPHAGLRTLPDEEEFARELLAGFDSSRREVAIVSEKAPDDILTRFDPVADPTVLLGGLAHSEMATKQQAQLEKLIRLYFDRVPLSIADAAWADVVSAGLGKVRFGWAGSDVRGAGHYYSVSGPTFLIEYDNTQDGANHIHSVWRDLRHDFGEDLLAAHYATHPH